MKIVIAGAGEVGTHLAKLLSKEGLDIILIDADESRLLAMDANYNLMTLTGSPTAFKTLKKAKGIGDYISNCIIERFEASKDMSTVYLELDKVGFSPNFISKLIEKYKAPQKVIDIVKNNP